MQYKRVNTRNYNTGIYNLKYMMPGGQDSRCSRLPTRSPSQARLVARPPAELRLDSESVGDAGLRLTKALTVSESRA